MASVNKVILIGNLGRDPEVRHTAGGDAVATFTMATTDRWADPQSGERKERTEWHRVVAWGKQAEIAGEYLRRGRQVYLEGSLQTREWTDQQGQKKYTTEIKCQRFQMLGAKGEGSSAPAPAPSASAPGRQPASTATHDDLPF